LLECVIFKKRLNTKLIFQHSGLACYIYVEFLCFTKHRNPKFLGPHPNLSLQFDISYFILFVHQVFVNPEILNPKPQNPKVFITHSIHIFSIRELLYVGVWHLKLRNPEPRNPEVLVPHSIHIFTIWELLYVGVWHLKSQNPEPQKPEVLGPQSFHILRFGKQRGILFFCVRHL
jgi:hypothetical protein